MTCRIILSIVVFTFYSVSAFGDIAEDVLERLEIYRASPVEMISQSRYVSLDPMPGAKNYPDSLETTWYRRARGFEDLRSYFGRHIATKDKVFVESYDFREWTNGSDILLISPPDPEDKNRIYVGAPGLPEELKFAVAPRDNPAFRWVTSSRDGTEFIGRFPDIDIVQHMREHQGLWNRTGGTTISERPADIWEAAVEGIGYVTVVSDKETSVFMSAEVKRGRGDYYIHELPHTVGDIDGRALVLQQVITNSECKYDFSKPGLPVPTSSVYTLVNQYNLGEERSEYRSEIVYFSIFDPNENTSDKAKSYQFPNIPPSQNVHVENQSHLNFVWDGQKITHNVDAGIVDTIAELGRVEQDKPLQGVSLSTSLFKKWWFWIILLVGGGGGATVWVMVARKKVSL